MTQGVPGKGRAKSKRHPGGAPSKIGKVISNQLELLKADGKTDTEIAEFFSISRTSLYNYKYNNPEFLNSIKRGEEKAIDKTEHSLFERANGIRYTERTVKTGPDGSIIQTQIVTKMIPPDPASMIFYLKNRRPEKWRDRPEPLKDNAERPIIYNCIDQDQIDKIKRLHQLADEL